MDDFIDEAIKAETSSGRVKYPDMVTLTGANGRIKSNEDINSKSLNRMATQIDKENAAQKGGVTTQHKSKIIAGILIAITIVLFLVLGLMTSGLHAGTITSTIQQTIDGSDVQAKLKRDLAELKVRYKKRNALEKAANEGDVEAQFGLWNDYYLEHDYDQALSWLESAVDQDYAPAQADLSYLYYSGQIVEQNWDEAFSLAKAAALGNDSFGQFILGMCYRYGHGGVDVDYSLAKENFEAAQYAEPLAENAIGELYMEGLGVKRDYAHALELFQSAYRRGCSPSYNINYG